MHKILLLLSLFIYPRELSSNNNKICLISIPKTGTHLLLKLVTSLTELHSFASPFSNYEFYTRIGKYFFDEIRQPAKIYVTHLVYNEFNKNQVQNNNYKTLLIIRDPRDMIVSLAYYALKIKVWTELNNHNIDEIISILIQRVAYIMGTIKESEGPGTIDDFYRKNYLPWSKEPSVYTTTFEKIVGPKGNGSKKVQYKEIETIAHFLGYNITYDKLEELCNNVFGNTGTFREGLIGSWKSHFSNKHKEDFLKIAGQLLIDLGYEQDFAW